MTAKLVRVQDIGGDGADNGNSAERGKRSMRVAQQWLKN